MMMMASAWPIKGGRNEATLSLAGMLAIGNMPRDRAEVFIRGVCAGAVDEEVESRVATLHSTYDKHERGENITGKRTLATLIEKKIVYKVAELLKLSSGQPVNTDETDLGNAAYMIAQCGNSVRFDPQNDEWYVFDGKRWRKDDASLIYEHAAATVRGLVIRASALTGRAAQDALQWAKMSHSSARLQAMVREAGRSFPDVKIAQDELDADPYLFNVQNGTINLRTGELQPHDRYDFISRVAGTSYIDDAPFEKSRAFLLSIMSGEEEKVAYLQRLIGSALVGRQVDHVLPLFIGRGRNGKDTLHKILAALFGDYMTRASSAVFLKKHSADRASPDIVKLRGVRFAWGSETEKDQELAEAKIKDLTGGAKIAARDLFKSEQEWDPTHTIVLATNNLPVIQGQDDAIWMRVHLVTFDKQYVDDPVHDFQEKKIRDIEVKLIEEELSGWLNWAVEGCLAWQRDGLQPPDSVKLATQHYQEEMDQLGTFLGMCCDLSPAHEAPQKGLWNAYTNWVIDNEEDGFDRLKDFKKALADRGFVRVKGRRNVTWSGLRLKAPDDVERGSNGVDQVVRDSELTVQPYNEESLRSS